MSEQKPFTNATGAPVATTADPKKVGALLVSQFLSPGATRVEHFLVTISDANGGSAQRDIAVTMTGTNSGVHCEVVMALMASSASTEQ